MLTKSKSKHGKGTLVEGDLEIGARRTFSRRKMSSPKGTRETHFPLEVIFLKHSRA